MQCASITRSAFVSAYSSITRSAFVRVLELRMQAFPLPSNQQLRAGLDMQMCQHHVLRLGVRVLQLRAAHAGVISPLLTIIRALPGHARRWLAENEARRTCTVLEQAWTGSYEHSPWQSACGSMRSDGCLRRNIKHNIYLAARQGTAGLRACRPRQPPRGSMSSNESSSKRGNASGSSARGSA